MAVYKWTGDYAQQFEGPNDEVLFAGPGDYVELSLSEQTPLAQEYFDEGLLIEAPGYQPGPAVEQSEAALAETAAQDEAVAVADADTAASEAKTQVKAPATSKK
jgi:hypothetical protein